MAVKLYIQPIFSSYRPFWGFILGTLIAFPLLWFFSIMKNTLKTIGFPGGKN